MLEREHNKSGQELEHNKFGLVLERNKSGLVLVHNKSGLVLVHNKSGLVDNIFLELDDSKFELAHNKFAADNICFSCNNG